MMPENLMLLRAPGGRTRRPRELVKFLSLWNNIGPRKTIGVTKEQVPEEQLTEEQKIRRKRQELLRSIY
ncbi:hypothetical protein PHG25ORF108c [Aeromonas phage 25]|uniref:Uncharacterized protein n=1 Tax=Aeromonas phage 25 TaxID=2911441 RepID=Q19CQ8_9CAUD|nr:hypothetical protein PHG25ORF108c [Aeromonas phage 25]ABF72667.1 hypothetical protein PHG25ORF108c [Aeromonas phage 25]